MTTMVPPRIATNEAARHRPTRIAATYADAHARLTTLEHGHFATARRLDGRGSYLRIALVGVNLALLGGDDYELQVDVGDGVTLEVVEPTGLVAYNAEGERATWRLDAHVGPGARLIWNASLFVAARGSNAHRFTAITLARGARALIRETLVLGRSGESGACLRNRTDIHADGKALLVEDLTIDATSATLPGIVAPARIIATITAAGWRPPGDTADSQRLDLAGAGAVYRALHGAMHHADAMVQPTFDRWRRDAMANADCPVAGASGHPAWVPLGL